MISMGFMAFYAPRGAETRAGLSRHLLAPPFGRPGRTTRCLQSAHCCSEGVNEKLTPAPHCKRPIPCLPPMHSAPRAAIGLRQHGFGIETPALVPLLCWCFGPERAMTSLQALSCSAPHACL
jgi:hypothetical protein